MTNRLANETSPYLLQHKDNPVDWYAWGPEALEKSKAEDRPIFLSVGYSACHWCHVMEHESFESDEIAALLNDKFVNIKVDREERPDLDQIYMNAVQIMTGHGGWPMSVFLTPDLQPFFGGTYWPPEQRMGMPGFKQVIAAVDDAWQNRREQAVEQAAQLTEHLQQSARPESDGEVIDESLLHNSVGKLEQVFDFTHGGFGSAPKFPHSMDLQVILRAWKRWPREALLDMARLNLDKMARGGIYDHLAGGFARYSVDQRWLVPHFEKMLYDNALLSGVYLDGFLATGDEHYARVVRETLDYILNYMTDPQGGFHSTEDADSEGEEGKFYVWTPDEVKQVLGEEIGERFCYVYDVSEGGNFEGKSILNLPKTIEQCASLKGWDAEQLKAEMADARAKLLKVRDQRVRPGKDDKILVSWNALMIDSMARAAGVLSEAKYLEAAGRAARFILEQMSREDVRLLHSWRHGQAKLDAYLDDYTYFVNALVTLYEASFEESWIDEAVRLADVVIEHFSDSQQGGFYFTADDHEQLLTRNKDLQDSSVPSGNSMAATALWRLGKLCGRGDYVEAARRTVLSAYRYLQRAPTAMGQMLIAADMIVSPTSELVLLGDPAAPETSAVLDELRRSYLPNTVVACRARPAATESAHLDPLFAGKEPSEEGPTLFVCENFACQSPAAGVDNAISRVKQLAGSH